MTYSGFVSDPIRLQHIAQGHHAQQLVGIGATDYGQQVEPPAAQSLQRQVKAMISMHVGK